MEKLDKANEIIKKYIKKNYNNNDWRYIDFVNEDRFYDEIKQDK